MQKYSISLVIRETQIKAIIYHLTLRLTFTIKTKFGKNVVKNNTYSLFVRVWTTSTFLEDNVGISQNEKMSSQMTKKLHSWQFTLRAYKSNTGLTFVFLYSLQQYIQYVKYEKKTQVLIAR